jgi:hypothetical protein
MANVANKLRLQFLPMSFVASILALAGLLASAILIRWGPRSIPGKIHNIIGSDPTAGRNLHTSTKFTVLEQVGHDKTSFV